MNEEDPTSAERQRQFVQDQKQAGNVRLPHIWIAEEDRDKVLKMLKPFRDKARRRVRDWRERNYGWRKGAKSNV